MDPRNTLVDVAAKVMNGVHRAVLRLSGGRILNTAFGMPVVELHTTGRHPQDASADRDGGREGRAVARDHAQVRRLRGLSAADVS
jgi:hypothetical protein